MPRDPLVGLVGKVRLLCLHEMTPLTMEGHIAVEWKVHHIEQFD